MNLAQLPPLAQCVKLDIHSQVELEIQIVEILSEMNLKLVMMAILLMGMAAVLTEELRNFIIERQFLLQILIFDIETLFLSLQGGLTTGKQLEWNLTLK